MDRFFPLLLTVLMIAFLAAAPVAAQGTFPLEGSQEVPPVTTSATGECNASLDALATQFSISCSHNAPAVAAHIHRAPSGMNGPIVFFLNSSTTFNFVVDEQSLQQQIDDALPVVGIDFAEFLRLLNAGDLYVNVHTMANPGGELRGQIPSPASRLIFAQWGNGTMGTRTLVSDIVLVNAATTGAPVTGSVSLYDEGGAPIPVDGVIGGNGGSQGAIFPADAHAMAFEIPPQGDVTIRSNGMGDLVAGSAEVESSADLGGYIRFAITGVGVAGVGESPITNGAIVPVRRSGTLSTGLAIRNAEGGPIMVTLSLRQNGVEVDNGNVTMMIDANSRPSMFLEQYFPDADTTDFEGTVVMTATGGFAAIALEFDAANGINTTLPVTPLN